jgi:hypothetical protein
MEGLAPAIGLGGLDEPVDLLFGQILPRSTGSDCYSFPRWWREVELHGLHGLASDEAITVTELQRSVTVSSPSIGCPQCRMELDTVGLRLDIRAFCKGML